MMELDIFREGEDVVGCVSHDPGVGGDLGGGGGAEDPDHLLHLRRWQWGGCHGSWQESRVDLSGDVILITMTIGGWRSRTLSLS